VLLVGALVNALAELVATYPSTGFAAYRDDWRAADYLHGREVRLDETGGPVKGMAHGIDHDGALLLETPSGERRRVVAGDVSVRSGP
jgi:BirA family biotin operon repressor/biotin-[acetyl-CoA-carboxylase] ligase